MKAEAHCFKSSPCKQNFTIKIYIFPSVIIYFYQLLLIIGKVTDFTYITMAWNEINTLGDSSKKARQAEVEWGQGQHWESSRRPLFSCLICLLVSPHFFPNGNIR